MRFAARLRRSSVVSFVACCALGASALGLVACTADVASPDVAAGTRVARTTFAANAPDETPPVETIELDEDPPFETWPEAELDEDTRLEGLAEDENAAGVLDEEWGCGADLDEALEAAVERERADNP